jgi:hypothetical protein
VNAGGVVPNSTWLAVEKPEPAIPLEHRVRQAVRRFDE